MTVCKCFKFLYEKSEVSFLWAFASKVKRNEAGNTDHMCFTDAGAPEHEKKNGHGKSNSRKNKTQLSR